METISKLALLLMVVAMPLALAATAAANSAGRWSSPITDYYDNNGTLFKETSTTFTAHSPARIRVAAPKGKSRDEETIDVTAAVPAAVNVLIGSHLSSEVWAAMLRSEPSGSHLS